MSQVLSQIDIVRRICDRGLEYSQSFADATVDIWLHLSDEITQLERAYIQEEEDERHL